MVRVFWNVWERSQLKTTAMLVFFFVVSKVFEKLADNRIVDHLVKCGLFSDFLFGVRSLQSIADLLTVFSNRISRDFNRSGATQAAALDITKTYNKVWFACWSFSQT